MKRRPRAAFRCEFFPSASAAEIFRYLSLPRASEFRRGEPAFFRASGDGTALNFLLHLCNLSARRISGPSRRGVVLSHLRFDGRRRRLAWAGIRLIARLDIKAPISSRASISRRRRRVDPQVHSPAPITKGGIDEILHGHRRSLYERKQPHRDRAPPAITSFFLSRGRRPSAAGPMSASF